MRCAAGVVLSLVCLQLSCRSNADRETALTDGGVDGDGPERPILEGGYYVKPDVVQDAVMEAEPLPDAVPAGWERWSDWSAKCPLYLPGEGAKMPAPIVWEPCSAAVPSYLSCRRMKDDWSGQQVGISGFPNFSFDSVTGAPLLQFTRRRVGGEKDTSLRLVAEVDGPVRNAILKLDSTSNDCGYLEKALYGSFFGQSILTRTGAIVDGSVGEEWGFLGGPIDERRPKLFRPPDPTRPSGWYISDQWVVQLVDGRHKAWSWDFEQSHLIYDAQAWLAPFKATVIGGDVFSRVGTNVLCGVMSWNLEKGSRPLLLWPGDPTHGAGSFGTDGKEMVWTYSAGPKGCGVDASHPEVWTAPYTTDPDVLAATARRLRKDVSGMSPEPYVVGFGHAMRTTGSNALFVVKTTTGLATLIPSDEDIVWRRVLGFTEDELFLTALMKDDSMGLTIVRIRLDSLIFDLEPD
jgi:hypothetical protein